MGGARAGVMSKANGQNANGSLASLSSLTSRVWVNSLTSVKLERVEVRSHVECW